ncbi:hypothetical protein ANAPH2_00667 [Anaplasma phagocytophilum]|nr:hypothetical protein ANAPH2_00667 [Anaplasma phagocytophilum]
MIRVINGLNNDCMVGSGTGAMTSSTNERGV